jgi:hypothetical protein
LGFDCAIAGAASAAAAAAAPAPVAPAFRMNERRSMKFLPVGSLELPDAEEAVDFPQSIIAGTIHGKRLKSSRSTVPSTSNRRHAYGI